MPDALLDTTVFIDYYRGHQGAIDTIDRIVASNIRCYYSPVSVFELWLRDMRRDEEMGFVSLLNLFEEATFDRRAAHLTAAWLKNFSRARRLALAADAMIAATAASRDATIYTRNVRDFRRLYANVESY